MNNFNSKEYWEKRYYNNGNSGLGSYGHEAEFKADYINKLINEKLIKTINDFGCGDSNQISKLIGFDKYVGFDVSKTIIKYCQNKFKDNDKYKFTYNIDDMKPMDMCISLDVTYHIIEENIFIEYMNNLFNLSNKYVLIYSINNDYDFTIPHMKNRKFINWININFPNYILINITPYLIKTNGIGFYLFEKKNISE